MRRNPRQHGLTLVEMVVVVGIIALLVGLAVPGLRALVQSFDSVDSVRMMIDAALASARTMAIQQQRYLGVRFQKVYAGQDMELADQYMIFILHAPMDNLQPDKGPLATGYREVVGLRPIKLPSTFSMVSTWPPVDSEGQSIDVNDYTTFSVVFSPEGRVASQDVHIRRANDLFNEWAQVTTQPPNGQFLSDDNTAHGVKPEESINHFYVVNTRRWKDAMRTKDWTGVVVSEVYVSPHGNVSTLQ